ncbi:MAG: hypothetical protein ACT4PE_04330 [Candidatus Eiseniibacteriota bacterium]
MSAVRVVAAGAAAAFAWWIGLILVFGPAQALLADPDLQSAKFLAAFSEPPLPRMAEQPVVLPIGLLVIGLVHALAYRWAGRRFPGPPWRRGLAFGALAWALMVPWFEFYLPWNVMLEPLPLVLLEAACWFLVLLLVGVVTAVVHDAARR